MKLYFDKDGDYCRTIESYKVEMSETGITEIELFEAKRETGTDYFFCKEFQEVGEVSESCRGCEKYKPNNGKNGRCKHYGYVYEKTDKKIVLKTR